MKKGIFYIILMYATLGITSCSGTRNLAQPQADLPESFRPSLGNDSNSVADIEWWKFYSDSTLCKMIERTITFNRDFLKAGATVEQLRQLYGIQKLNYTPDITGNIYGNQETNNYDGAGTTKDPEYGLKASIAWEVNLWGAMTWSQREAKAKYMASVNDMRAMQMTLIAETASAYFRLIALDNELSIVRQTLITRSEALHQAQLRFEGGLTSETVFQQAKVEYATTASLVPNLERQIVVARNALSLLMGEFPAENLERGMMDVNLNLPDRLPAGIPSELLTRRPDLRASEQRLKAAMANVGLTYADRFPTFRIGFTGGLENNRMENFFKSPFTYVVGSITGTIFDFGKKKRKYQASIAAYEQARYSYEQSVMTAFHEVDNAIETCRRAHESAALKVDLRDAAAKYVQLALLQYRGGALSYIDVLDAQRRYFDAQIGVSNAVRDQYLALVNLYKVLGGGWKE